MSENNQQPLFKLPKVGLDIDISSLDEVIEKMEKINSLSSKITNIVPIDDYLLKTSEVAVILGINVGTVGKLIKSGHLKSLKLGSYKIRKKELDRFMVYMENGNINLDEIYA